MDRKTYFTRAWASATRKAWDAARKEAFAEGRWFSVACNAPAASVLYRPHGARA
jgi:hypothetical protein